MRKNVHAKHLMRMLFVFVFVFTTVITTRADVIADWNVIVLREAVAAARQGGSPAIDIATMHAAMYDAVQAIEKDYDPYRVTDVPNATGLRKQARIESNQ